MANEQKPLRSQDWFGRKDKLGFIHRSWMRSEGFPDSVFQGKPVIGICNSWSELTNCNVHLRSVAEAVKRGVWSAGGFPLEFPTISLGEPFMRPSTMMFRNLMAMDVEESIRANPLDGIVLLCGCDKTTPAQLMGAASADLPSIMVTGGPMLNGKWRNQELGSGTDVWRYSDELRAGRILLRQGLPHQLQPQAGEVHVLLDALVGLLLLANEVGLVRREKVAAATEVILSGQQGRAHEH